MAERWNDASVGRPARPLRGLLPHLHRSRRPASASGSATRWSRRCPRPARRRPARCGSGDGSRATRRANVGEKVSFPVAELTARRRAVRAADRRRVLSDDGHGGGDRAGRPPLRVGPRVGAAAARLRSRASAAARAPDRQDDPLPAAPGRRGQRHGRARRPPDRGRAARGAARHICGAPSTRRAGRGCTATTSSTRTAAAPRHLRRRRERVRAALRARARARTRRWSRASAART